MLRIAMLMSTIVLVAVCVEKQSDDSGTLVFEKLGVLLQRSAIVAHDTDESIFDVFMKIPLNSTRPQSICGKQATNFDSAVMERVKEAISLHNNFTAITENAKRSKRSLLAGLLGGGLLSIATSAISGFIVSNKVNKLKREFSQFASRVHEFQEQSVAFDRGVIQILKKQRNNQCVTEQNLQQLQLRLLADEKIRDLDGILDYLKSGQLAGLPLNPDVFPPSVMRKVLQDHPEISKTLYNTERLEYVYLAVTVYVGKAVLDEQNRTLTIHFLFTIPWLTELNTFPLYSVKSIPFRDRERQTCRKIDLPQAVIAVGNFFVEIDMKDCIKRNQISLCYSPPFTHLNNNTCLTQGMCKSIDASCETDAIYDKHGLMVHTLDGAKAVSSSEKPEVTSHNAGFKFFAWKDYDMVTYNHKTMYAPSYYQTYIVANSGETYKPVQLENWTYPEIPVIPTMKHIHSLKWGVIVITGMTILMAGTVGICLLLKKFRCRQGLLRVPSHPDLQQELSEQEQFIGTTEAIVINN